MMRDWKSTAGVLLIFVLGCLAGGFVVLIGMHHRTQVLLQQGSPAFEKLLERRLSWGLHMTDDQRARFHQALLTNIEARRELQETLQPQVRGINEQTRRQLAGILDEKQLEKLRLNLQAFRRQVGPPGLGGAPRPDEGMTTNAAPVGNSNAAPALQTN